MAEAKQTSSLNDALNKLGKEIQNTFNSSSDASTAKVVAAVAGAGKTFTSGFTKLATELRRGFRDSMRNFTNVMRMSSIMIVGGFLSAATVALTRYLQMQRKGQSAGLSAQQQAAWERAEERAGASYDLSNFRQNMYGNAASQAWYKEMTGKDWDASKSAIDSLRELVPAIASYRDKNGFSEYNDQHLMSTLGVSGAAFADIQRILQNYNPGQFSHYNAAYGKAATNYETVMDKFDAKAGQLVGGFVTTLNQIASSSNPLQELFNVGKDMLAPLGKMIADAIAKPINSLINRIKQLIDMFKAQFEFNLPTPSNGYSITENVQEWIRKASGDNKIYQDSISNGKDLLRKFSNGDQLISQVDDWVSRSKLFDKDASDVYIGLAQAAAKHAIEGAKKGMQTDEIVLTLKIETDNGKQVVRMRSNAGNLVVPLSTGLK